MSLSRQVSGWLRPCDVIGATLSFLCVIHCMAMPLVIVYLPVLGLEWLARNGFHRWVAVVAILFGAMSFTPGYIQHRRTIIPFLGTVGLFLLGFSALAVPDHCCTATSGENLATCLATTTFQTGFESSLTPLGGILLVISHALNCRWAACCRKRICQSMPHVAHRSSSFNESPGSV
ncbi:MAG: hypothetical protein JWM11_5914 [Planctomycetaceae bacterium]|nr:hypothetical protein [Planctomycetaceae bacterium]